MTDAAQGTVLVVDDNSENRALARATLEDEGFDVILAEDGPAALREFDSREPDCILLDVRMPGMDGFEVCRRIRSAEHGRDTPIVFLTALRDLETFERALREGGDDFLSKPVRPAELLVRVQAALKLRKLSGELRGTYDLMRRQRDDLMRVQLQKERLMAFVVHDLKNPVNSMDLHAQLLLRDQSLSAAARDSAQRIRDSARSLTRMVLNLLDISRSEEGRLDTRRVAVELAPLVAEVVEPMRSPAEVAGVRIETQVEVASVPADPDMLRRVLENLLDNGLRHAPANSELRVSIGGDEHGVELRISDAGAGVAEDMRDKIFERFQQLESGERLAKRSGRGLGLAFCKLAVEAMGGTICVQDANPGAAFCVRLPRGQ